MSDLRDLLVRNEQAKLTATYLNGVAIALVAVGGIAPWIAAMQLAGLSPAIVWLSVGCITTSTIIHAIARRVLRGLRT